MLFISIKNGQKPTRSGIDVSGFGARADYSHQLEVPLKFWRMKRGHWKAGCSAERESACDVAPWAVAGFS